MYTDVCDSQAPLLEHLAYVVPDTLPMLRIDTAKWLATHTSYPANMSASEYKQYEKIRADSKLTMPGRLGVKESLHSMFMHTVGLCGLAKSTYFCLTSPAGIVCVIFVDSFRMDLSHQTVFLDAALLPPKANVGCVYLTPIMAPLSGKTASIFINEDKTVFWKHLLPTFAERCRSWHHKSTCEYQAEGYLPISTEDGKPLVCSCGSGVFPEKHLDSVKHF